MFGLRISVDPDIRWDACAGRCVPSKRLSPTHGDWHERVRDRAVRARRHATWVIGSLAPKRRGGCFAYLGAIATTLRRKTIAHAIGRVCGRRIEQEHCGDSHCLEEGSHEGETKVYRSEGCPQENSKENSQEIFKKISKEWDREGWQQGVKPGCEMSDGGRGERTDWWSVSPPVAQWVNAAFRGSIPSRMPVLRSRSETLGSSSSRGVRVGQSRGFGPLPVPRRSSSAGTTAGNPGCCERGRYR